MQTRRLGRTGHESTLAIFGAVALDGLSQRDSDVFMEDVINAGVNHIDVAPSYGNAEERLGPTLAVERDRFFLGCKTDKRTKEEASKELERSLKLLQVDSFDLYQLHAVTTMKELDQTTSTGGALETAIEARDQGLTRFVGITGHGMLAPSVFLEALKRFDFDTVLFALNFILLADPNFRRDAIRLLHACQEHDIGVMIIKAIAKGPWGDCPKNRKTWYQPFEEPGMIQRAVNFVLSQDVSGLITAGDVALFPKIVHACEHFNPMGEKDQEALIAEGAQHELIFDGPEGLWPD